MKKSVRMFAMFVFAAGVFAVSSSFASAVPGLPRWATVAANASAVPGLPRWATV